MIRTRILPPLIVALLVLPSCDVVIEPPDAIDAYFTLWGALDPVSETQALRVVPILPDLEGDTSAPLDVTMTATDLVDGSQFAWRDSLVEFDNGTSGHVFLADFRPEYGRRYRIDVTRPDGARTTANVRVPQIVEPFREETVFVPGDALLRIIWPGAPQLNRIEVTYLLQSNACDTPTVTIPFEGDAEPFEFGWMTTIRFADDALRVLDEVGNSPHAVLLVTLSAEVASEDGRLPGGVFDPEILIEPGTFSNVEHGFGFVGGAYPTSLTWRPEVDAINRTAFRIPGFSGC